MKLTEQRAIQISMKLWKWLAETGKVKEQYPDFYNSEIYLMEGHCPCCQYYKNSCTRCLLYPSECDGYVTEGSVFAKWFLSITKNARKKYALIIYKKLEDYYNLNWSGNETI